MGVYKAPFRESGESVERRVAGRLSPASEEAAGSLVTPRLSAIVVRLVNFVV